MSLARLPPHGTLPGYFHGDDADGHYNGDGAFGIDAPRDPEQPARGANKIEPPISARNLCATFTTMRVWLINMLIRFGETMNLVGAPKARKSWLVLSLLLCFVAKRRWLGIFETRGGRALLIDAELHLETLSVRMGKVADALGIAADDYQDRLDVVSLRGKGITNLRLLEPFMRSIPPGRYQIIAIDAAYRFFWPGFEENGNPDWTDLYNILDRWAAMLGCGFVLVHHTTKGVQSNKEITDVGSGGSAQARCPDAHVAVRAHEEEDAVVMAGVVRSFEPLSPIGLRWNGKAGRPIFTHDPDLDVTALKRDPSRGGRPKKSDRDAPKLVEDAPLTPDTFTAKYIGATPMPKAAILSRAGRDGVPDRTAKGLLAESEAAGMIFRHPIGKTTGSAYSTKKPDLFSEARTEGESAHTSPTTLTPARRGKRRVA
jgi:hypothetical protein